MSKEPREVDGGEPGNKEEVYNARQIAEIGAGEITIVALQTTLAALKDSNDRLREQLDADWKWAKGILVIAAGIISLVFGTNIFQEMYAIKGLRDRSDELRLQIVKSEQNLVDSRKAVSNVRSLVESLQRAYRVTSDIRRAQDHLYYRVDARRALVYADEAEQQLEDLRIEELARVAAAHLESKASGAPPTKSQLTSLIDDQLLPTVWLTKTECAWELGQNDEIVNLAGAIAESKFDSKESQMYLGAAKLSLSLDEPYDSPKAKTLRDEAIRDLEASIHAGDDGAPVRVMLAAACFQGAKFTAALRHANRFLQSYPSDPIRRHALPVDVQAQIAIAAVWRSLAELAQDDRKRVRFGDSACVIDTGAMRYGEGLLYERLFVAAVRNREKLLEDKHTAYRMGLSCANAIRAIRLARTSHVGCGGQNLVHPVEELQIYPALTRDKRLGVEIDGKLRMRQMELRRETKTRSVDVGNERREEVFTIVVPVYIDREFEPNEEIPEARYVPYHWNTNAIPSGEPTPAAGTSSETSA